MNRPIDWKKISELKRQAALPPEVPLGDMLSELLESEIGMSVWDEPAVAVTMASTTFAVEAVSSVAIAQAMAEPPLQEISVAVAAGIPFEPTAVEPIAPILESPEPLPVVTEMITLVPEALPLSDAAEPLLDPTARIAPARHIFEAADPHFTVKPNLEIHSKVEMALSELSESSSRYAAIDM